MCDKDLKVVKDIRLLLQPSNKDLSGLVINEGGKVLETMV